MAELATLPVLESFIAAATATAATGSSAEALARRWADAGCALLSGFAAADLPALREAAERALAARGHRRARRGAAAGADAGGSTYAARDLLAEPAVAAWAAAQRPWVASLLGAPATPISGLLLDKHAAADWRLPLHQDLAVPVRRRADADPGLPGWGPWSRKDGLDHAQPPPELAARRLALRVHLDDCALAAGALTVLPGSHRALLADGEIDAWAGRGGVQAVAAAAGDVLVLHPWLLHGSLPRAAGAPGRRRVLHLEYAGFALPAGLRWTGDP
jgi:hypothetical protein